MPPIVDRLYSPRLTDASWARKGRCPLVKFLMCGALFASGCTPSSPTWCAGSFQRTDLWRRAGAIGTLQAADPMTVLARDGRKIVVAGLRSWPGDTSRALVITELGRGRIPPPPGGRLYMGPEGAVDSRGTLHLIWAEPTSTATAPPRRLLYSSFRAGRWTKPAEIFRSRDLSLYLNSHSDVIEQPAGTLHFVFTASTNHGIALVHLRHDRGGWLATEVPQSPYLGIGPGKARGYPSIVSGPDNELVLTFVSSAVDRAQPRVNRRDISSVFSRYSTDGGESWSDPVLIYRSGGRPATQLRLLRVGRNRLQLLWLAATEGAVSRPEKRIIGASSTDGGRSWSTPAFVSSDGIGKDAGILAAAGTQDGRIALAFTSSLSDRNPTFWIAELDRGGLRPLVRGGSSRRTNNVALTTDERGSLQFVWAHAAPYREGDAPGFSDLRLSYATISACNSSNAARQNRAVN